MIDFVLQEPNISVSGDFVLRTGKYFEVDTAITDKNGTEFMVTAEEADAVIPAFTGCDITINHQKSPLDGFIGRCNKLWRQGKDIMAEYAFPKALHESMGGAPIKVSSEWDIAEKRPTGLSLVLNPAVSDAVMCAAQFAKNQQSENADGKKSSMNAWDSVKALFSAASTEDEAKSKLSDMKLVDSKTANFSESAEFQQMNAQIAALKTQNESLTADFALNVAAFQLREDLTAITDLVKTFKVTPANAERYKAMAKDEPAKFSILLPELKEMPAIPAVSGVKAGNKASGDSATAKFQHNLEAEYAKGLDGNVAFAAAKKADPEVYKEYAREMATAGGSN